MTEQNKGKKAQRTFSDGVAHILATFNNTIINITDIFSKILSEN